MMNRYLMQLCSLLGLYFDNRAWDAANKVLSKAIVYEPNNASLYNALGISLRGLGEIDKAEEAFRTAIKLNPSAPEPLLNIAVLNITDSVSIRPFHL